MKTHRFLTLFNFLNSFAKENRIVFLAGPETSGETGTRAIEDRIHRKSQEQLQQASDEQGETATQQDPLENVLDQLTANQAEADRQAIFIKLLNKEAITTSGDSPQETTIDLSTFSETQFATLLKIATESLSSQKDENLKKILEKISLEGPFDAGQLGKESIKFLLDYTVDKPAETQKIMTVISISPTRISDLIDLYKNDITKLKELLPLIPDYLKLIKKWLTDGTLSNRFATNALAILINNDIFPIQEFLEDTFIQKITFRTQVDLLEALTNDGIRKPRLMAHIRKNIGKVIEEDSSLIDQLLRGDDNKGILGDIGLYLKENANSAINNLGDAEEVRALSVNTISELIVEFHQRDKELMEIVFSNISKTTRANLLDNSSGKLSALSDQEMEKILIKLNPLIKTAIDKFGLKKTDKEYRRSGHLGFYFFKGSNPEKIYYENLNGTQSCPIKGEEKWTTESNKSETKKATTTIGACTKAETTPTAKLYTDMNDTVGTDAASFKLEIIQPVMTAFRTGDQTISFVKAKTTDSNPKEVFVKLTDIIPLKDLDPEFGIDHITTEETIFKAATNTTIPKGEKLSIFSESEIKIIGGREFIKAKWLKKDLVGFIEKAFIKPLEITLQGEKAREIYEQYSLGAKKIEATERSLQTGEYHVGKEGVLIYPPISTSKALKILRDTKFEIKEPQIYKITRLIPNSENPENPTLKESFVVKYENAQKEDGTPVDPGFGYIEIDGLIPETNFSQEVAPDTIQYATSEWTNSPEYSLDKKVPTGKETVTNSNTFIFGTDERNPEKSERINSSQTVTTIEEKVRLIKGIEYVKVKTTLENKEVTGWIPLADINIEQSEMLTAETAEETEKAITRKKRDELLTTDPADSSGETFIVNFKYPEGHTKAGALNRSLQASTKINDLFPTSESEDKVEITPNGKTEKITAEFKNGLYYIVKDDVITKRRAIIMDGDKIKFMPKRAEGIDVTKVEEGNPDIRTIDFLDSSGRINKTLERTIKLTDIFTNIKEGDKVIITPKGKGTKSDIAEFKKNGSAGENFYYTMNDASGRKIGSRAIILHGDKVQLVRKAETIREIGNHYGTFQLPEKTLSQKDLMTEIYAKHPTLKEEIAEAGLTEHEYYKQILKTKERDSRGSHLYILKPKKSLAVILEDQRFEKQIRQGEVSQEDTQEHQRIATQFDHYYTSKFKIKKSLLQYVNDDELWNNLWAHKGAESDKYVDGLEKVVTIMRENFQLNELKVRDTLREIIQIGYNDRVDFEDIFEFLAKPLYLKLREEYGDKLEFSDRINTYKDFEKDLKKTSKTVKKWQEGPKKDDLQKIVDINKEEADLKEAKKRVSPIEFKKIYDKFIEKKRTLTSILSEYNKEYLPASRKLSIMVKKLLVPTARLLDAIAGMELGVSKKLTAFQEYNNDIEKAEEVATTEIPEGNPPYYDLSVLSTPTQGELPSLSTEEMSHITEDGQEKYAVTIAKVPLTTFRKVGQELGLTEEEFNSFKEDHILKLIFQLYSIQTLTQQKCLKKVAGQENVLLLTKLPDNFNKETQAVKRLFENLRKSSDIDSKQDLIKETAKILDNNKKILGKIAQLYGKESATVRIAGTFSSRDTVELDMHEIGAGAVTLPKDFFTDHMSGQSAQEDIIGRITSIKDGLTILDEGNLIQVLSKDLRAGLSSLPVLSRNLPELTALKTSLEDTYGSKLSLSSITDEKLYKYLLPKLEAFITNPEATLSGTDGENITKLIKIGRIFNVITNQNEKPEDSPNLPTDPAIAGIVKAIIEQRKKVRDVPLTQEDVTKIEQACIFGIGAMAGTSGNTGGVGLSIPFDLGDGWSISLNAGIGANQGNFTGGGGVSVSKTFSLSKDGKTQLTVGVDAGYPYVGGHIKIQYAISEKVSMGITGVAGWIPGGFYAGGVISFHHEPEWERKDLEGKEMIRIGYDLIDKMIAKPESEETIANTILLAPDIGKEFRRIKAEFDLPDKSIIELYKKQRSQTSKEITDKIVADAPIVSGGGIGLVWVQTGPVGIPVPNFYLEFNIGREICVFRTTTQGAESLDQESQREADAKILRQLQERHGDKKVTLMQTEVPNDGQFIYDSMSGQTAFLKGKQSIDFNKYDQFNQLNTKLNGIGINLVPDKKTRLTRIEVPKAQGNVKFLIDPEIKEQLIVRNGEVYITIGAEHTDLIFEKENFSYPYQYNGSTSLSIITIKRNPTRTRDEIEDESPSIVYQKHGYQPEIRKGLRETALRIDSTDAPAITTYQQFEGQASDPERLRDAEKAEQMNAQYTKFITEAGIVKERETTRTEFDIKIFGDKFLEKHKKDYKRLSTRLVTDFHNVEKTQKANQELNALINSFANNYEFTTGQRLETLRDLEMQRVLTYLMTESFMKLPERSREKVFRHNLESFGRKYLEEFFGESAKKLGESIPPVEIKTSPAQMAQYVISDLKDADLNGNAAQGLEKMGLLSLVGTDGIKGLRGTPLYGSDMASKMLELTNYKPGSANKIESDIGKVIIELASPLDTKTKEAFMKSPLAVKMLAHPGIFLILGAEDAMKVAECFNKNTVSEANKTAFEKFQRIVLAIRAAQYSGRNIIDSKTPGLNHNDFPADYSISVNPTTSIGVYQKCGNPTIAFDEGIAIFIPNNKGLAGETQVYTRVDTDSRVKFKKFKFGIAIAIEPSPDQTPKDPDQGPAGGDDATSDGTGNGSSVNGGGGEHTYIEPPEGQRGSTGAGGI